MTECPGPVVGWGTKTVVSSIELAVEGIGVCVIVGTFPPSIVCAFPEKYGAPVPSMMIKISDDGGWYCDCCVPSGITVVYAKAKGVEITITDVSNNMSNMGASLVDFR